MRKQISLLCLPSPFFSKHICRCYLVIGNLVLILLSINYTIDGKSLVKFSNPPVAGSAFLTDSGPAYLEGDYRPLIANISFSQGGSAPYYWEVFIAGSWMPTSIAPEVFKPLRIIINQAKINAGASSANSYNDIVVINGGELIISEDATSPSQNFINPFKALEVESGGKLFIEGDIKMQNSTSLIIRAGGSIILDQNSISNTHGMWGSVEAFEEGSAVIIKNWKWNASTAERSLIDNATVISNNIHGYKFGNLILEVNPTALWTMISGATGVINLCENNFEITNSSAYFITGASNESGINGFKVNGNMVISKGAFSFGSSYTADNFNHQFIINGTFECKSSSVLKMHHLINSVPLTLNGFVTFKNNVKIASTVSSVSNDASSSTSQADKRMYVNLEGGTPLTPLLLDVAPTVIAISINIKSNSYVQLKEHDLDTKSTTGNTATISVETGATFDFSWASNGTTPLVIKKTVTGNGTNKFVTLGGSFLKITSPDGISETTAKGNVQYSGASNKTFSQAATFWYIGKENQMTGDGLSNTGNARQVIIEMSDQTLSTSPTQCFSLTNGTTASPTGGKLDIRRGQFLETETAYISGVINENNSGTLYMAPGTLYRISSLSVADVQKSIPRMAGVTFPYQLIGGTIELSAKGDQTLRGNKDYRNLTFSNNGTKTISSAPTSVTGTILITDDAILDVGINKMGGANTNFTMTGNSKYVTAGVLTKPDAEGVYDLGPGTTIEFTNANNLTMQDIRLGLSTENPVAYNNIIISGNNVGNSSFSSTPITMQAGSTFTVTGTGTFKLKNANGFSGAVNTCITNTPAIILVDGSTIEYNRDNGTNQNISNQQPYKNLVLSGSGTKTGPADNLVILGDISKKGAANFTQPDGAVVLDGNAIQTITSNSPEILFNNLVIKNTAGVLINNDVAIYKELTLAPASKITLNTGNITLRSGQANTANVGKIATSAAINYNAGRFVVERYINTGLEINGQHSKSWQFLSVPSFGESIRSTWQENKMALNTYGTWITGNDLNWAALGFDAYSPGPSMKTYDVATNKWAGISGTDADLQNAGGYMIFIRGDRTVTSINQAATPCILRSKGKLYAPFAGYAPAEISVAPNSYKSVGNPYASQVDLEYMFNNGLMTGIDEVFYVWDPLLTGIYGLGGYQTISKNLGYKPVPGIPGNPTQNYDPAIKSNFIESGQAFFVHNSSGANGTLTFTEDCKAPGNRLVNKEHDINTEKQIIRAYLFTKDKIVADGNAVVFGENFSDFVDHDDALKILNAGENFGLTRDKKFLAVEARKPVIDTDTIFFQMENLLQQTYYLQFKFEHAKNNVDAFLVDRLQQTATPLYMEDSAFYGFRTNKDSVSLNNRFMLLLKKKTVLPVTFTSITAYHQNKTVVVTWQVANEFDVANYSIEKSGDAVNFVPAGSQQQKDRHTYTWVDVSPIAGYNYYRVKSTGLNGEIKFSEIASVRVNEALSSITVYPNPVKNRVIKIYLKSQPAGLYQVRIFNSNGALIVAKDIDHSGGNGHENVTLGKYASSGIYWLEINKAGETTITKFKLVN